MVKTGGMNTGYFSYIMHQVAEPLVIRFMTSLPEKKSYQKIKTTAAADHYGL